MKVIIIFAILSLGSTRNIDDKCNGVIVHNINHEKEILKSGLDSPYQLAIDYDTHTIFFSYTSSSGSSVFESAYINLKTNEFNDIPGINGGFANAVDSKKHIAYLGGRDGLYTFNFETKQAEHIEGTNHNIWQMFFREELYYTVYPNESAYFFKYGDSDKVSELESTSVMLMALDIHSNIYYSNSSGLFVYRRAKEYSSGLGDYNVNGFTTDANGNLYFSTPEGIYFIESEKKEVQRIASIKDLYGVAIDIDGNIIYASSDSIIRLRPTKTYCHFDEKNDVASKLLKHAFYK